MTARPVQDRLEDVPDRRVPLTSEVVYRSGRVIDVRRDVVPMPGGEPATRDVVVHPGAVGIIAVDDEQRVLLVRQYRHPVGQVLWEPPAGLLDAVGEDPLAAARRELWEETHHTAERWDVLVDAFTTPGMCDEAVRIYLARDVRLADGARHDGADEERGMPVRWWPLADALAGIQAGRLHNPLIVMGVLAAVHALGGSGPADADARRAGLRPADAPWPQMSQWPGSRAASS